MIRINNMSFWQSELGEVTGSAEDAFAKSFTTVPDNTTALARIAAFILAEHEGNRYLSIDWLLTDGEFKGVKVNQKLKVWGDNRSGDPAKLRHRALNMFKLLYQLFNLKPTHANDPTDEDLRVFIGKHAGLRIMETRPDVSKEGKTYNWVSEVHAPAGFKCVTGVKQEVHHVMGQLVSGDLHDNAFARNKKVGDDMDDEIPF